MKNFKIENISYEIVSRNDKFFVTESVNGRVVLIFNLHKTEEEAIQELNSVVSEIKNIIGE